MFKGTPGVNSANDAVLSEAKPPKPEDAATDALVDAVLIPDELGTVILTGLGAVIVGVELPKTPEMLLNVPGVDEIPLTDGMSAPGLIRLIP
jgi:hypothetical protein